MTDDDLIAYYSKGIPVDDELLRPLGLVMWAAIRLHHGVRDVLQFHLRSELAGRAFDRTLGGVITDLIKAANRAGEPWKSEMENWKTEYGTPAVNERNAIAHAIAFTAEDGTQALMTSGRQVSRRITVEHLEHAAGHLTLSSVRLTEAQNRCEKA